MHTILMLGFVTTALAATTPLPLPQRPERTMHGSQGAAPPPVVTVAYERTAERVPTEEVVATFEALADEARRANRLSFEDHGIELPAEIELKQSYIEWSRPGYRRYSFSVDLKLGGGQLRKSEEQHNAFLWNYDVLGFTERSGITAQEIAEFLEGLATDLGDGRLAFEGHQLEMGEMVDLFISHTVGDHHDVAGVQIGIRFGEMIPAAQRSQIARKDLYRRESESLPVQTIGQILERLGREIQQRESVDLGGTALSLGENASFEIVSHQDESGKTGLQIEFLTSPEGPSAIRPFFVPYERRSHAWAPADVARTIAAVADSLTGTGRFVFEDAAVTLEGLGAVEQKLVAPFGPGMRRYASYLSISFGPEQIPTPLPEYVEEIAPQEVLAKDETTNANGATLGRLMSRIAKDLQAGAVRLGGQELAVGNDLDFRLKHTSSTDGRSHRIQLVLFFGEQFAVSDEARAAIPAPRSHARESSDIPITEIAALFQRLGTEILKGGTFSIGGTVFHPAERAYLEFKVLEGRGLDISVSYRPPTLVP